MSDTLQDAILLKDAEMLSYLLSSGININRLHPDGRAPLNAAIASGDDVMISLIMGADPEIRVQDSFRVDQGAMLQPIHYACIHDRLELVIEFLSRGVHIDQADEGNCTPLHHAAKHGHIDLVLFLLEGGSDVNWESNSGRTPLWKAARGGHTDLVQLLISRGAQLNVHNKVGETVLFECVPLDYLLPITGDLLECGINVNAVDIEGNTALHKAASLGKTKACQVLIDAGINVNAINEYNNTALHNACMQNQVAAATVLINYCMCITRKNRAGHSPLYVCMLHQQTDTTRFLHNMGARLTAAELEMFIKHEAHRNERKELFWRWCQELFGTPKALSVLCYAEIRRTINKCGYGMKEASPKLPLPRTIRNSLVMEDYFPSVPSDSQSR